MSSTVNVLTNLGPGPFAYKEIGLGDSAIGILTGRRCKPRIITAGLRGYYLGLHNEDWAAQGAGLGSGTATYFVRIVPICQDLADINGEVFKGTPTVENTTKALAFSFIPFPDGYFCTGYEVWAGTVSGTLYKQGTLTGRFNCVFTIETTWTYVNTGSVLSAQTIGPPAFTDSQEVYQLEGTTNARLFLGGGRKYTDGYLQVAKTTSAPLLACGTSHSALAVFQAVTSGSFRSKIQRLAADGSFLDSYIDFQGINLSGAASLADVASTLQTAWRSFKYPRLITGVPEVTMSKWTAIADGSFDIYMNGAVYHVTGLNFSSGVTTLANVATKIQAGMVTAGLTTATCVYDSVVLRFIIKVNASLTFSYLFRNSSGTGTDISIMLAGRETSDGVQLNRFSRATNTDTIAYSTDHFVFTGATTGHQQQIGWLETCLANDAASTDVSALLDGKSTSITALNTPGQTAKRSAIGKTTKWGNWCEGMKLFIASEGTSYIVDKFIAEDHIHIDSDYDGGALFGPLEYSLQPYNQQVYICDLGNPFKYEIDNIIQLPTSDSDEISSMAAAGSVVSILMDHHIWFVDGVDITSPRLVDSTHGCPYLNGPVPYKDKAALFTGEDFVIVSGSGVQSIDPDKRVRHLIQRLNSNYDIEPFGVYLNDEDTDVIMWWMAVDNSFKPNVALCYEPTTGNWWVYNHKSVSCASILRDANKDVILMTALPADENLSIPSFTLLHSRDYHADAAAIGTAYDRQGLIGSVGANTATGGFMTCGACGTLAAFQAVTKGYFTIEVDDGTYLVGPCDFSAQSTLAGCASIIQTAIRAKTGGVETCVYSVDHFVIASGTTTNRSVVDYLRAGYDAYTDIDISGQTYLNGRENFATITYPVNTLVLNLTKLNGSPPVLYTANDGEKSTYVFLCDSNYRNGQYVKVSSNTATQMTVTPVPSTLPAAGWRWYVGGIVPSWLKWFDFNSPHHKNKIGGIAITVPQTEGTSGNILAVHGMQDLVSTIRTTKTQQLGIGQDPTNTVFLSDKPATQQGIKLIRPSADYDLEIDDLTVIHTPIV